MDYRVYFFLTAPMIQRRSFFIFILSMAIAYGLDHDVSRRTIGVVMGIVVVSSGIILVNQDVYERL